MRILTDLRVAQCDQRASIAESGDSLGIQLFGDLSLDGLYCDPQHHAAVAENMREIANRLGPCDLRVANWESPLWGDGGVNPLRSPRLATTEAAARCVLRAACLVPGSFMRRLAPYLRALKPKRWAGVVRRLGR